MKEVKNRTFNDTRVELDNTFYEQCKFNRCEMVYSGSREAGLSGCSIIDCKWVFAGAAEATLRFMAGIYPHATELIELTFDGIRKGKFNA